MTANVCGQTLPVGLVKDGYTNQLCVDFSAESVTQMTQENAGIEGVEWKFQDVCQMDDIPSKTIDVAFDKGTLDAMVDGLTSLLSPTDEVLDLTGRYMREVRIKAMTTLQVAPNYYLQKPASDN